MSLIEFHQPLVAQVADGERLGRVAERHQRDQLRLVEVHRQRVLARHCGRHHLAALVVGLDIEGRRLAGVRQRRAVGLLVSHRYRTSRPCAPSPSPWCGSRNSGRRARATRPRSRCTSSVVRAAMAQQPLEVVALLREQARVQRALGREAQAIAVAAEGLRHRGNDADLARAVAVAPALGNLAAVVRVDRLERVALADRLHDLRGGHHVVHAPAVGAAHVHVLDEAHDVPGAAPALGIASTWSLVPRFTTMLILIGAMPAAAAASMPSITFAPGNRRR